MTLPSDLPRPEGTPARPRSAGVLAGVGLAVLAAAASLVAIVLIAVVVALVAGASADGVGWGGVVYVAVLAVVVTWPGAVLGGVVAAMRRGRAPRAQVALAAGLAAGAGALPTTALFAADPLVAGVVLLVVALVGAVTAALVTRPRAARAGRVSAR